MQDAHHRYLVFSNESIHDLEVSDIAATASGHIGGLCMTDTHPGHGFITYDTQTGYVTDTRGYTHDLLFQINAEMLADTPVTANIICSVRAIDAFRQAGVAIVNAPQEAQHIQINRRTMASVLGTLLIDMAESWMVMYHFPHLHTGIIASISVIDCNIPTHR